MIKNVKKKGRIWCLPDSRLKISVEQREPGKKIKYIELSANTVTFISCRCRLTGSSIYFIFSLGSLFCSDVYRHEPGRCCTLPFFLTFILSFHLSRFFFYVNFIIKYMSILYIQHFMTIYLISQVTIMQWLRLVQTSCDSSLLTQV